jgi:hypothetical protein
MRDWMTDHSSILNYVSWSVWAHCTSRGCVYGTGIASETLLTSATELPVCPDTQASFICLYVFAMVKNEGGRELDAVAWTCDPRRRV